MSSTQEAPSKRKLCSADDEYTDVKRNKVDLKSVSENFPFNQNGQSEIIHYPAEGTPVNRREFRRVGPYILGPKLGHSAVESISQYLAKKENSDEFVHLKILHLLNGDVSNKGAVINERQAKMLLHTEFSLLSLLQNEVSGVIKHRGMFSDMAYEEDNGVTNKSNPCYTGKVRKRLVLVLDCISAHDYSKKSSAFINLQQYLTIEKKLPEIKALQIFYEIISVVENLHKRNIIHRDLKLGNIVLNKSSNKIIITNFCLGKYLLNENDLLYDQRGSPAYISPDVLCGPPYKGKPSDIWALGVVLFMMLYGRFPFYESTPAALFRKIRAAEYSLPTNMDISTASQSLIHGVLVLRADHRLTATQVREKVEVIIFGRPQMRNFDQFVPTLPNEEAKKSKAKPLVQSRRNLPAYIKSDQLVPQVDGQQSKCNLTKNCSVPLTPISQSFLRPSSRLTMPTNRTAVRPMTQNEIGQVQFIIFNNAARNCNTASTNDDSSNWQATIRFHNNGSNSQLVTQQMRNLSLRHRRELGLRALSWHDVRTNSGTPSNHGDDNNMLRRLYLDSERPSIIQPSSPSIGSQLSVDTIQPLLNLVNRMFCMNEEDQTQASAIENSTEIQNVSHSSQLVPSSSATHQSLHNSIPSTESLERIVQAINSTFIRGRIPQPTHPFIDFNGTITEDLATKIGLWFNTNYREHPVIQRVFHDSSNNAIGKVHEFLTRCGVQTLTVDGLVKIKLDQPFELLLVMTYLLQAAGYTYSYLFS